MSNRSESDDPKYRGQEGPDPERVIRGKKEHERRWRGAATKQRITIRLDRDVVEGFKELTPDGGYQALMNQALREWLQAGGIKELVLSELRDRMHDTLHEAAQDVMGAMSVVQPTVSEDSTENDAPPSQTGTAQQDPHRPQ